MIKKTEGTVEYLESNPLSLNSSLTLYQCGWENCRRGHTFGPAVRPHYLFHYVFRGKGVFCSQGKEHYISAGQGFLICPGDSTVYRADQQEPWDYCWFGFDGHEVKTILERCGLSLEAPVFVDHSNGVWEKELTQLVSLFTDGKYNDYEAIGRLYLVFSQMVSEARKEEKPFDKSYADKAVDFIRHNYSYPVRVADLARHIGIDRTYLFKIFKRCYRMSPQQYLIQFRLHIACTLLENSAMTIAEIAYSCGFQDIPAFYKHFKNRYAFTPSEYRARQIKNA